MTWARLNWPFDHGRLERYHAMSSGQAYLHWEHSVSKQDETISGLKYNDDGLIPAVVIDSETKEPLMMAWMNAASLKTTIETGRTHFWSRSRQKYWMKGESSGHVQQVKAICVDCDLDTLVIEVVQQGAACHEGYRSCFFRQLGEDGAWQVSAERVFKPEDVYGKGQ